MARSWERMVEKNKKELNMKRKKQGQSSISTTGSVASGDRFKGRKIIFPFVLIMLAVLYGLLTWASSTLPEQEQQTTSPIMNWFVVVAYIALGVILYLKRPYLLVNKDNLQTPKLNRVRSVPASDITKIKVAKGSVVIEQKGKGGNWVFTRLLNRYDVSAMGERLEQFAKVNNIPFEK